MFFAFMVFEKSGISCIAKFRFRPSTLEFTFASYFLKNGKTQNGFYTYFSRTF